MAQTIKLKRSATAGAAPTTSQLELGEVAINTYDGKMYIKKSVGGTESIVEISGGGGASAADAIFEEYLYTATSNQTAFSGNDDNSTFLSYVSGAIQVFLNGVLLDPETDYTATNGATVTLTSGAATGDYLQIIAFKKKIGDGSVTIDTFSGNNSTTAFTLSLDPGDENNTRVFIDGVYQSKSNYTVSGTTLTFSSAPPSGTDIEVEIGNRVVSLDTTSSLDLPDNVKLRLGTSQDLEIFHDGSNSYVKETGPGALVLQSAGPAIVLEETDGTNMILANTGGAVTLYHAGSSKLETTSTGIDVTGNIVVSGTVDGRNVASDGAAAVAALPRTGGAMTGAITTNSTFDGRDVATDGAKLDGIESGATADQTQSEINALGITATGLSGTPAISVANITTTGELRGPASFVVDPAAVGDNTGTVIIKGNLQVDGATTTINSTTLTVDDLNLTLASGAANGTAANGAGITVDGASATITYNSTGDSWDFNKDIKVTGNIANTSGDLTLDVAGDIILDADGGDIRLADSGTQFGKLSNSGTDLVIESMVSNRDMVFKGVDAGASITALTLDMSNNGKALFNHGATFASNVVVYGNGGAPLDWGDTSTLGQLTFDGSGNPVIRSSVSNKSLIIQGVDAGASINALTLDMANAGAATFNSTVTSTGLEINGTRYFDNDYNVTYYRKANHTTLGYQLFRDNGISYYEWNSGGAHTHDFQFVSNNSSVLNLATNGNVNIPNGKLGIGFTSAPTSALEISGSDNVTSQIRLINTAPSTDNLWTIHPQYNDQTLRFRGNGSTDVLTLTDTGNVGIGIDNPATQLNLKHASGPTIMLTRTSTNTSGEIGQIVFGNGDWDSSMARIVGVQDGTNDGARLEFKTQFNATGTEQIRMVIKKDGLVGIGTTSPMSPLVVKKNGVNEGTLSFDDENNNAHLTLEGADARVRMQMGTYNNGSYGVYIQGSYDNNASGTGSSGTEPLILNPQGGNVGIGTTSPANKLHVKAGASGATTFDSRYNLTLEDNGENYLGIYAPNNSFSGVRFVNADNSIRGHIDYYLGTQGDKFVMYSQNGWDFQYPSVGLQQQFKPNGNLNLGATHSGFSGWRVLNIRQSSTGGMVNFDEDDGTRAFTFANQGVGMRYQAHITGGYHRFETHALGAGTAMMITDAGKVGIGTASPDHKLHVVGDNDTTLVEFDVGPKAKFNFAANSTSLYTTSFYMDDTGLDIGHDSSYRSLNLKTAGTDRITILPAGNVGIGTTSPSYRLHVYHASNDAPMMIDSGQANGAQLRFASSGTPKHFIGCGGGMGLGDHEDLGIRGLDNILFSTGGTANERMRLASNGDWIVSNTNPRVVSQFTNQAGIGWYEGDLHAEIGTTNNRSALEVGRNNANSGDVITIRQQSASVGMIGTEGGDSLVIQSNGSTGSGLRFHPSAASIQPVRQGVTIDNTISLGDATRRFKDLNLAGKILVGDNGDYEDTADNFNGGIVFQTPLYTEYQWRWNGTDDHETNLYCGSYFMAEIVFTQHQTNGGTDINRHLLAKWANNHTHHELETIHDSGSTWSMTTSITATDHNLLATGASGTSANGRLRIVENYGSGSYSFSTLTVRVYMGTLSNVTHTYG